MSFRDELRLCRSAAGLTQAEVAQRVGVSGQAVYGWERGLSSPSVANVVRLETLFGLAQGRLLLLLAYPQTNP